MNNGEWTVLTEEIQLVNEREKRHTNHHSANTQLLSDADKMQRQTLKLESNRGNVHKIRLSPYKILIYREK